MPFDRPPVAIRLTAEFTKQIGFSSCAERLEGPSQVTGAAHQ